LSVDHLCFMLNIRHLPPVKLSVLTQTCQWVN